MEIKYTKHFFCFMDILGYKSMVTKAEGGLKEAISTISMLEDLVEEAIIQGIEEINSYVNSNFETIVDHFLFSDSVCLAIELDEEEGVVKTYDKNHSKEYYDNNCLRLYYLSKIISNIQLEALKYGIIFRGVLTIGNHYRGNNIVFSKALVDAYLAEQSLAKYPRIIVLPDSEDSLLNFIPFVNEYYQLCFAEDDDFIFVDYLDKVVKYKMLLGADCDYVKDHKKIIEKGIEAFAEDAKGLGKYAWMMNYHHSKLLECFDTSILISTKHRSICIEKFGLQLVDYYLPMDQE